MRSRHQLQRLELPSRCYSISNVFVRVLGAAIVPIGVSSTSLYGALDRCSAMGFNLRRMIDISAISKGLFRGTDGIWYSSDRPSVSYSSGGNEQCFEVEDRSFWFAHRNACIATIANLYPPEDAGTIFDIGGGNGFVALGLKNAGFEVAVVEPGIAGAVNAKKRGISPVICATSESANFSPGCLPALGLFDVVEHIEDDLAFLQSLRELLKSRSRLYLTVPAYTSLWSEDDVRAGHFRRYRLENISNLLRTAGYQIEFSSYIFRFLPAPIFLMRTLPFRLGLSRKKEVATATSRDHVVDPDSVPMRVLSSLLQSEIECLRQNKPMRFGGSCLLVAQKSD